MDCKTCKALRAEMDCNSSTRATSISAHLHEAIMARQERIIRRLSYALALSAISNLLIVCAVVFHV